MTTEKERLMCTDCKRFRGIEKNQCRAALGGRGMVECLTEALRVAREENIKLKEKAI